MEKELKDWLEAIKNYKVATWYELPDVPFYMDQLLTYLGRQLSLFVDENDKGISSFMINNYVKGKVIPAPTNKKYEKDQIAYLIGINFLKKVVSLEDLTNLFKRDREDHETAEELFAAFKKHQEAITNEAVTKLNGEIDECLGKLKDKYGENTEEYKKESRIHLTYIAFKQAIEAEVNKMLADKMLALLAEDEKK